MKEMKLGEFISTLENGESGEVQTVMDTIDLITAQMMQDYRYFIMENATIRENENGCVELLIPERRPRYAAMRGESASVCAELLRKTFD